MRKHLAALGLLLFSATSLAKPSDQILPQINSGWIPAMAGLEKQLDPNKNYVTLLVKLPVDPMDLRSAELFRRSMLPVANAQNLSKHALTISHMMVAWRCHTRAGQAVQGATGQTGEFNSQSMKMFLKGWGLSSMYAVHLDGVVHTPAYVQLKLDESVKENFPFAHITFEVEQASCENMLDYLTAYIDHPGEPMKHFGLTKRPEEFEGGGCGSFASAMLQKAGVLTSVHATLWRTIRGPRGLMGARSTPVPLTQMELPADVVKKGRRVSLNRLLVTPWDQQDSPPLTMVDPELMTYALRVFAEDYFSTGGKSAAPDRRAFSERVIYSLLPYMTEDVQRQWIPITEADPAVKQTATQARAELAALKSRGFKIRPAAIGPYFGLIVGR